jgi:chromosome segregation protein
MLKRLELIGFKSFADRTWFTFPPGLTAVVGPNGSGKSNVVDAVKWILGEQSAKSLRGGEMADVIFNGSASRKGLGMAEVTLTMENTGGVLNTDAAEVSVSRRVYRDGTGEYLINGQISRLKDVRDLFLGSGAGSTSYCIIEQGRVDGVLQASNQNRRAILEEAAGISRFKAKKVETLRKLDHTQDNLNRLRDILGEVEARLRRVRLDAEKARKFQEYGGRLRELRVGVGLREYHALTARLGAETAALDVLRADISGAQTQVTAWDGEAKDLDTSVARAETEIAQATEELSDVRRRIATFAERQANESAKAVDVAGELAGSMKRALELGEIIRALEASAAQAQADVASADGEAGVRRARADALDASAAEVEAELAALKKRVQDGRDRQFHLVGRAAALKTEAASTRSSLDRMQRERDRKRRLEESKAAELASVGRVLDTLGQRDTALQTRLGLARQALDDRRHERDAYRVQGDRHAEALEDLRVRRSGLTGRIEILEGLELSQEGLGTGVREVLAELADGASALSRAVVGLVADSLRVPRDVAPLIDVALGDVASAFVVRDSRDLDAALAERGPAFAGRVSFLPLVETEPLAEGDETVTADRWVTCEHPDLAGLPRQLLGTTRIVDDLATARTLAADPAFAGFRFVTRAGERLDPDGSLTVGPHRAETGILSRKSELRDLKDQAAVLDAELTETERRLADARDRAESLAGPIHGLEEEIRALTSNAADVQTEILKQTQQRERLTDDIAVARQEWEILDEEIGRADAFWREARAKAEEAEHQAEELKAEVEAADQAIRGHEHDRAARQQEQTAARVALAEVTQRLTSLKDSCRKFEADLARGREEAGRIDRHHGVLRGRIIESELAALRASAGLAEAYRVKEAFERHLADWSARRDADRDRRRRVLEGLAAARAASQDQLAAFHARELAAQNLENGRAAVADRLRDDYQLDLAAEYAASPLAKGEDLGGPWDPVAAPKEIEDLRKKIRHLGNVSLESLTELSEVEGRATELQAQIADLTEAERSLREIIAKINDDSKRLFTETYDAVRAHFQELFRKLFGGGMADIVLENPEDVLETGIDIVARPPGKELRGISLMSGGEKTLTAVALLLAIFRSKPSPFCLLDEVDAALDEANTERLAKALKDFTDRSQFIVITHKKRTMAYADVLYGITMQESGVSKQVSVTFEDWPEDESTAKAA